MADCPSGKDSWEELVGTQGEFATKVIKRENQLVDAIVVKEGSSVTADFRWDRVRVWVNDSGIVTMVPRIG